MPLGKQQQFPDPNVRAQGTKASVLRVRAWKPCNIPDPVEPEKSPERDGFARRTSVCDLDSVAERFGLNKLDENFGKSFTRRASLPMTDMINNPDSKNMLMMNLSKQLGIGLKGPTTHASQISSHIGPSGPVRVAPKFSFLAGRNQKGLKTTIESSEEEEDSSDEEGGARKKKERHDEDEDEDEDEDKGFQIKLPDIKKSPELSPANGAEIKGANPALGAGPNKNFGASFKDGATMVAGSRAISCPWEGEEKQALWQQLEYDRRMAMMAQEKRRLEEKKNNERFTRRSSMPSSTEGKSPGVDSGTETTVSPNKSPVKPFAKFLAGEADSNEGSGSGKHKRDLVRKGQPPRASSGGSFIPKQSQAATYIVERAKSVNKPIFGK